MSHDTGLSDETYLRDYEGKHVSGEDLEEIKIVTSEDKSDPLYIV